MVQLLSASPGIPIPHSQPLAFHLPCHPHQIALLMIDFQGDFCHDEQSFIAAVGGSGQLTRTVLPMARSILHAARQCAGGGLQIIHTLEAHLPDLSDLTESKYRRSRNDPTIPVIGVDGGNGRMLIRGEPCNGLMSDVASIDGEVVLHKPGKGAFCDTELRARLDANGVTHLIVCGVTTECCVQSTMREANDRGYDLLVVEDATASCVARYKTETIEQLTAFGGIVGCSARGADVIDALDALAKLIERQMTIPPSIDDCSTRQQQRLPVIDVAPIVTRLLHTSFACARQAVDADCLRCAAQIDNACRRFGFFYVVNHGITPPLECARSFFALDLRDKLALKAEAGEGAGYEESGAQILDEGRLGDGIDGVKLAGDRKESYIVGKSAPSQRITTTTAHDDDRIAGQWPDESLCPGFKETLVAYHDQTAAFCVPCYAVLGSGLGWPRTRLIASPRTQ